MGYTSLLEKDSMDLAMLDAAVKYKIIPLLALFKEDLESILSIENVVEVLLGAHRQNVEFYKRCAIDFIHKHWEEAKLSGNIIKLKEYPDELFEICLNLSSKKLDPADTDV